MPMPSFFGGRRRMRGASVPENLGVNPLQPVAQKPDIPTGEVRSRRSFMGGPSTLAVIGATLRQMDGGNELDEYLSGQQDQQYQRDMFGLRAAQGKREDEEAQTERTSLAQRQQVAEEYIRSLPADQQMRARVAYTADPEAFAASIAEQMSGGGWQVGQGYSHAFRPRPDGTIEMGGQLPLRPRSVTPGYDDGTGDDWEAF
jgi:hypothetical protein